MANLYFQAQRGSLVSPDSPSLVEEEGDVVIYPAFIIATLSSIPCQTLHKWANF